MQKEINSGIFIVTYHKVPSYEKKIVKWLKKRLKKEKHNLLFYEEVEVEDLQDKIRLKCDDTDIIFIFGETNVEEKDITIEKVEPLLNKRINSFEHIFSNIAFDLIDSEALFLRTLAGKIDNTFIFCFPSNYKVFKFFAKTILFPELEKFKK